jgi:predicted NBD/HSP70 family sugar kinase
MAMTAGAQAGPATPSLLRSINDRAAFDLLLEHGQLSRSQIGRLTGLSKPTASQLLARMEADGLVVAVGSQGGRAGRLARMYEVDPRAGSVVALDVTPSRIEARVADVTGTVTASAQVLTGRGEHDAVRNVTSTLDRCRDATGSALADLRAVVIATPGSLDPSRHRLDYAKHLSGWHEPALLDRLTGACGTEVHVENDVNLAALAEQRVGAAVGCDDFFLFWADEGLGGALVLGGRLHRGSTGGAGEIGFMQGAGTALVRKVRRENAGAFQTYAGPRELLPLGRRMGLRGRTVTAMAQAAATSIGDGSASFLDEMAVRYAAGIASVIAVVDPGRVVLGGPVALAAGEPLRRRVQAEVDELAMARPDVLLSTVSGNAVLEGALGAALERARDNLFAAR